MGGQGRGNVDRVAGENIVALCEVDTERGKHNLAKYSKAKHYTDFRKMLTEIIPASYDVTMTYASQQSSYLYPPEEFNDKVIDRFLGLSHPTARTGAPS